MRIFGFALWSCAVIACSSSTNPSSDAGVDAPIAMDAAPASCGPIYLSGASCDSCARTSCCQESMACAQDPECKTITTCIGACATNDHACFQKCAAAALKPTASYNALKACELKNCKSQCPFEQLVCGGSASKDLTCDACIVGQCCAEVKARNLEADALAYANCVAPCTSPDCVAKCVADHPTGAPIARTFDACNQQKCLAECPSAPTTCIGKVMPPAFSKTQISVTVFVNQYVNGMGIPNALVKACDLSDACATPRATGMTDSKGNAALMLDIMSPGFTGYFSVTDGAHLPINVIFDRPFVDNMSISAPMVSAMEATLVAQSLGTTLDLTRGAVTGAIRSCQSNGLPFATLAISNADMTTKIGYTNGAALPVPSAKWTDESGLSFALNVPVGMSAVTSSFPLTSQKIATLAGVPVAAGTLTLVVLDPN